jgi:hypothetical protein
MRKEGYTLRTQNRNGRKGVDMRRNFRTRLTVVAAGTLVALLVGAVGMAMASPPTPANGTFTQTAVTGFQIEFAGPNVIIEQTTVGVMDGTLSGTVEDSVRVVIHSDGTFTAHGTTVCQCSLEGREGLVRFTVTDSGEQIAPGTSVFSGRAAISSANGDLSGLSGLFDVEGSTDIPSGLSTFRYSGQIHFHP